MAGLCPNTAGGGCEANAGRSLFCVDFSEARFLEIESMVQRGGMVRSTGICSV